MQSVQIKQGEVKDKIKAQKSNGPQKSGSRSRETISDNEAMKILEEVQRLLGRGETLECINLLRALKDNMQGVKNPHLTVLVIINLGILYYQVGFLEQASGQFAIAMPKQICEYFRLKELSQKVVSSRAKDPIRIKYDTVLSKLELQVCILYSQLGKHDLALEHAQNSSKVSYNLIYDILARLYSSLNKLLLLKGYQKQQGVEISLKEGKNLLNNIAILNHLINSTKDLKLAFLQKERLNILDQQLQLTRKFGCIPPKIDIEQLYSSEDRADHLWIYKNKILDEIQLMPFQEDQFEFAEPEVTNHQIIEKITYLAISLYCYSTETRFIEKQKQCDSHDVLDSQHWLSRSLEIAYSFLPPEAPILNQIITVHDRFHGLDKQTIPEDEEVTGFFKVLKPLSKPKSTYSSKSPGCSPIMIRIQADKVDVHVDQNSKTHREMPVSKNMIQLQQNRTLDIETITKNNKIRNYSHGHQRVETSDNQIAKTPFTSRTTIDIPQIHNPNIRTNYASKKFGQKKTEKLRVNLSELNGKAIISEDLLSRPHSLQEKNSKPNYLEGQHRLMSERRKKSLPSRKTETSRKGNQIKFEGLQLKGHRMEETVQSQFFERLHNQTKVIQSARIGGNVYINNNINLFISPGSDGQTFVRGQVDQRHEDKDKDKDKDKDLSRRQIFLNKRRANNFVGPENCE